MNESADIPTKLILILHRFRTLASLVKSRVVPAGTTRLSRVIVGQEDLAD